MGLVLPEGWPDIQLLVYNCQHHLGCSTLYKFLVDNLLAADFLTVKQQLLGRYVNFFHAFLKRRIVCQHDGQVCLVNTRKESDVLGEGDRAGPWRAKNWCVREKVQRIEVPRGG